MDGPFKIVHNIEGGEPQVVLEGVGLKGRELPESWRQAGSLEIEGFPAFFLDFRPFWAVFGSFSTGVGRPGEALSVNRVGRRRSNVPRSLRGMREVQDTGASRLLSFEDGPKTP